MTQVSHPILRLEVLRPDGTRTSEYRVFCRYQRRSVVAGTCCACAHCDAITNEPEPAVVCSIPAPPPEELELASDPTGERTEVGAILRSGMVALDPAASIGDALAVLRSEDRRSVAVVDATRALVGVVHEVTFVRPGKPAEDVAAAMSSALALHESTPVRRALRLLASSHLREATVTDGDGVPLGVFRDVDGLRWLALARAPGSAGVPRRRT
jgi:CBS domain-containing protein